jgi:hypothetical protein
MDMEEGNRQRRRGKRTSLKARGGSGKGKGQRMWGEEKETVRRMWTMRMKMMVME